jgi:RHS repeat-associated protein
MAEYDDGGNCLSDFIYMGNRLVAEYRPQESKYYYYASDQINSIRMITDDAGTVVYSTTFDPFGGIEKAWVSTYDPVMKFSGKEREPANEMDYFGARYYAHTRYRWISPDPVVPVDVAISNPQGWNLYSYVRNNPLSNMDPAGLYAFENGTSKQQRAFANALNEALKIDDIKDIVASYGKEGENNGVTVRFEPGNTKTIGYATGDGGASVQVLIGPETEGNQLIIDIAHEGSHVADWKKFGKELGRVAKTDPSLASVIGNDQFDPTKYDAEVRAYNASAKAAIGLQVIKQFYGRHTIMEHGRINQRSINSLLSEKYGVTSESRGRRLSGVYQP